MNCPNCGAQYDPSMRNCPSCGSVNPNPVYQAPMPPQPPAYSPYVTFQQVDPIIVNLLNQANSAYNFALTGLIVSIVATLLCGMGFLFGWIFSVVSYSKYNSVNNLINLGGFPLNDFNVNEARKKLATAKTLNWITIGITIAITVTGFSVFIIALASELF